MVTQELGSGGVIVRESVPSSDVVRVRFGEIDGLRALAIVAIVIYETIRLAPPLGMAPGFARAAADASQGLALFLAISGFTLAYPALAAMRQDGSAYLDVGRYLIKRVLRIYPAYLVALGLAIVIPPLALRYGLPALASGSATLGADAFFRNAIFVGGGLGNEGFTALGLVARCYLVFPFALLLWTRFPKIFAGLVVVVAAADAFSPAHRLGIGAFVPFALGIVAADVRVQHHRIERFALGFALLAAIAAFFAGPFLANAHADARLLRFDPLWSLAFAALIVGAGASQILERALGVSSLRLLGAASFAISLVVVPVASFALRQLVPSVGAAGAAVNAAVLAIVAGFVLWQLVDRWFGDAVLRRSAADVVAAPLDAALRLLRIDRVRIGALEPDAPNEPADPRASDGFYAPPPRPILTDLASMSQRSGSPEDLAAEIHEMKKRLAERSAAIFDAPATPAEIAYERPGFYRKAADQPKRVVALTLAPQIVPEIELEPEPVPEGAPEAIVAHFVLDEPPASKPIAPALEKRQPIRMRIGPAPTFAEDAPRG